MAWSSNHCLGVGWRKWVWWVGVARNSDNSVVVVLAWLVPV